MAQVVDYYHERLLKTPAALAYLEKRGLKDEKLIERFKIGFADRSLGLHLPEKGWREGKAIRERLQKIGILRDSGHEHFNGSIVVPIFDEAGNVAEMYGRQKSKINHLYLPGPHAGIWNARALDSPETILCEAPFDALTFWMHDIKNITFIYGTQGFTDELFDALLKEKVKSVRLAYDNDAAGNRAAARDAERLAAVGIEVYRVKFPHGMDVNEYATKVQPASQSLATAIKSAEWLSSTRAPVPSSNKSLAANLAAKEKTASASGGSAEGRKKKLLLPILSIPLIPSKNPPLRPPRLCEEILP